MSELPNPFEFAGVVMPPADKAAASIPSPLAQDAAAAISDSGDTDCPPAEAAATLRQSYVAAAEFCDIGEIFVGARKLEQIPGIFDQDAITPADELRYVTLKLMDEPGTRDLPCIPDEQAFMDAIDPMPIFLEQMRA